MASQQYRTTLTDPQVMAAVVVLRGGTDEQVNAAYDRLITQNGMTHGLCLWDEAMRVVDSESEDES